jgi:hypothetical protein
VSQTELILSGCVSCVGGGFKKASAFALKIGDTKCFAEAE